MSFGDSFLDDLNTIVTLEPYLSISGNNTPSRGPLRYYRAYIDATGTLFRNAQGQQVVDSAAIYMHPLEVNADGSAKVGGVRLASIRMGSRLGIPDLTQSDGMAYPVLLKVDGLNDETGAVQIFVVHT
jgi:hypothetical protein